MTARTAVALMAGTVAWSLQDVNRLAIAVDRFLARIEEAT